MRTSADVVELATNYLKSTLPARCVAHQTERPKGWFEYAFHGQKIGANEWPAVFVDEISDDMDLLETTEEGDPVLDVAWTLAVQVWVIALKRDARKAAREQRAALKTAIVEALIDRPSLTTSGLYLAGPIRTEYSGPMDEILGVPCCYSETRFTVHTAEIVPRDLLVEAPLDLSVDVIPFQED